MCQGPESLLHLSFRRHSIRVRHLPYRNSTPFWIFYFVILIKYLKRSFVWVPTQSSTHSFFLLKKYHSAVLVRTEAKQFASSLSPNLKNTRYWCFLNLCQGPDSNRRPHPLQGHALPTELPWHTYAELTQNLSA